MLYSEEFLPGDSLAAKVSRTAPLSFPDLLTLFSTLLELVEEMIRIGHLHRDIKPGNIMATMLPDRPYVVLDMGIAHRMSGTQLTQGNTPPGTLRYMAPELLQPNYKDVMDFRCDLYSSALSVYEVATGIHPFAPKPEYDYATLYRIMNERPDPLSVHRPDICPAFCNIIDRCLKKNPSLRYARLELVRSALKEVTQ